MTFDRLVSLLLLLEARTRMTVPELAEALGVSERTVRRDVARLALADLPVFTERGRYGGVVLVPGSQLDLARLGARETELLGLPGLDAGQAAQLGMREGQQRLRAKLDAHRRRGGPTDSRARIADLVHVDNSAWFGPEHRASVAGLLADLRERRRLSVRYRSSGALEARAFDVDPLGLFAKSGRWYLVAERDDGGPRLLALERLESWTLLDAPATARRRGELATVADRLVAELETRSSIVVDAVIDAARADLAARILGSRLRASAPLPAPDDGLVALTIAYDDIRAARQLLQFGPALEVRSPASVRAHLRSLALATAALYAPDAP